MFLRKICLALVTYPETTSGKSAGILNYYDFRLSSPVSDSSRAREEQNLRCLPTSGLSL
ncbi:MAG: hypothetical protein LWX56_04245 [Ignavibacteria bacterium]|nr:hypothetical protein [Ignavibacteria bacterium]